MLRTFASDAVCVKEGQSGAETEFELPAATEPVTGGVLVSVNVEPPAGKKSLNMVLDAILPRIHAIVSFGSRIRVSSLNVSRGWSAAVGSGYSVSPLTMTQERVISPEPGSTSETLAVTEAAVDGGESSYRVSTVADE